MIIFANELPDRWYPDRESNSELSFRRALLYPFNYQGQSRMTVQRYKKEVNSE